jgi:hypothetical protein
VSEADILLRLAAAVADGERVEWPRVMSHFKNVRNRVVADGLRTIAEESAGSLSVTDALRTGRPAMPFLVRAVVALGLAHVALGLAAYALGRVSLEAVLPGARVVTATALGVSGVLLYFGGRDERTKWLGAIFVALASGASLGFARLLPLWPGAPIGPAAPWGVPLPDCLLPWLLWRFAEGFPAVVRFNRLEGVLSVGARISLALGVALALGNLAATLGLSSSLAAALRENRQGVFWLASFAGSAAPLVMILLRVRHAPEDERRRVRWFAAGLLLGLGPFFTLVAADAVIPAVSRWLDQPGATEVVGVALFGFELTLPATVGYAVASRRIFAVRVVVRRAVQRALARTSLSLFTLLPGGVLVFILWRERANPVSHVLGGGVGLVVVLLLAATILLLVWQRSAAAFVERLFEPDTIDYSLCLARLARMVQESELLEERLLHLGEIASSALGGPKAMLLIVEPPLLRPIQGSPGRALPLDSALFTVLEGERAGVMVGPEDPHSLFAWLPEGERQWVVDFGISVVNPIWNQTGILVAAAAFASRPNGNSYAESDLNFISAAVASVGTGVLRSRGSGITPIDECDEVARECRACGSVVASSSWQCPTCDGQTVECCLPAIVNGKYSVRRVLGRGGMGVVYLAQELALGREIALKTLPRVSAQALVRLRAEARAMASVAGPHLATIHTLESWRGVPILAVEYLSGGTAADRARTPRSWDEVRTIAVAVAGALGGMHAQGLIHGDVKPSNIGFARDGTPKLLDFGLSRLVRSAEPQGDTEGPEQNAVSSQSGRLMGTLRYLSPERLRGARPSPADDLWALAMACLECLVGAHPLKPHDGELRRGRLPAAALGVMDSLEPAIAREFLARALALDARARFRSAIEFAARLHDPSQP